ncbi:MAG: hypothetical protein ACT4O0_01550 [Pseudonocardia sp.]
MAAQVSEVAELVAQLRAVLAVVESGELVAERDQVAWLRGVVAGLEAVSQPR